MESILFEKKSQKVLVVFIFQAIILFSRAKHNVFALFVLHLTCKKSENCKIWEKKHPKMDSSTFLCCKQIHKVKGYFFIFLQIFTASKRSNFHAAFHKMIFLLWKKIGFLCFFFTAFCQQRIVSIINTMEGKGNYHGCQMTSPWEHSFW